MRMKVSVIVIALFIAFSALAQGDSVAFTIDSKMPDGVYLQYADFRKNDPITVAQIESKLDKEQLNFIEKTMQQGTFTFNKEGQFATYASKGVWGFFQNNTLYVNYKGDFYRVPVFGAVSYMVATVLVSNIGFYDPMYGGMGGGYTRETREFLIDFYDGVITELTLDKAGKLLSRDKTLYDEFIKLSRKRQKEQLYRYIRRYNELHPVYFLK